jgi:anti-anti-sigma factor
MDLVVRQKVVSENVAVIEATGEMHILTVPRIREHIVDLVNRGYIRLVLDLRGAAIIGSEPLGTIVDVLKRTRNKGGTTVLLVPNDFMDILLITGLGKVFNTFENLANAVEFISGDPLLAEEFENIHDPALIFRVYIPSARLYAAEASRMMALFHDWLIATRERGVRKSGYRTASGEVYEFFTDVSSVATMDLREEFEIFSYFLAACTDNQQAAVDLLTEINPVHGSSLELVGRIRKEALRIKTDLRHERERRLVSLRQEIEQKLIETGIDLQQDLNNQLSALLGTIVPDLSAPEALAFLTGSQAVRPQGSVTVNISQQIISAAENTIIQNVQGVAYLGPQAKEILSLIDRFGGDDVMNLRSAVHEMEDEGAPSTGREAAIRQLKLFLGRLAGTVHHIGLDLLERYLESKVTRM